MPEMLQSLELLHHSEKFKEIAYSMIGPIWVEDSKTVSITFLGAPSTENTPEMLLTIFLIIPYAEKFGKWHIAYNTRHE